MITDEMIEAAARALCRFEQIDAGLEPDERQWIGWREQARIVLEAAERAAWQPIETAPKDGTLIDLWCVDHLNKIAERITDCWWGKVGPTDQWAWNGLSQRDRWWRPTHWRPLPGMPQ